jgi:predicted GNAT family acetyltransferase
VRPHEGERLYRLRDDPPAAADPPPGRLRAATPDDLALLLAWSGEFTAETGHAPPAAIDRRARMAWRVAAGQAWLWDVDGTPAAMAFASAPVAGAVRIGPVYTPPEHRRHGYAGACVGAVGAGARAAGARDLLLYTQLANPTSNGVYQRLGYEAVAEITAYTFG